MYRQAWVGALQAVGSWLTDKQLVGILLAL